MTNDADAATLAAWIEDGQEWERITRKRCRELLAAERYRRKADPAFSGHAPINLYRAADLDLAPYYGDPRPLKI